MSRSNPSDNTPNPSTRWHEWAGGNDPGGFVTWYNKAFLGKDPSGKEIKGRTEVVKLPFTFILLDELARVSGWHEASQSGITSNEVRDTQQEVFVVKAFKGGPIATGLYSAIKDRVKASGGYYATNCYIAYKDTPTTLAIGAIEFAGASLNTWVEFKKLHRAALYSKAVQITGYTEHKKGKITFRNPVFAVRDVTEETNKAALEMDQVVQNFLKGYFSRTKTAQVATTPAPKHDEAVQSDSPPDSHFDQQPPAEADQPPTEGDDVPF